MSEIKNSDIGTFTMTITTDVKAEEEYGILAALKEMDEHFKKDRDPWWSKPIIQVVPRWFAEEQMKGRVDGK